MLYGVNLKKPLLLEQGEIILDIDEQNKYYPVMYKNKNNWVRIVSGDIIQDWITYVKIALNSKDGVTGEICEGYLYPHQWEMSICIINTLTGNETKFIDVEAGRQSGKTFLLEHILGFITPFGGRYKKMLGNSSWVTITMSHKDDSAKKNYLKIRANTKKAVDIYNQLYGSQKHRLVYGAYKVGDESKTTIENAWQFNIDVLLGNTSQGWSELIALTAKASQDGYMASVLYADEAILIDSSRFMKSFAPFASRNAGSIIITGIASTDSNCLQFSVHNMKNAIKFIYPRDKVFKMMKATHPIDADIYYNSTEALIEGMGGHNSTEAQTNFHMSWEITDGKFTTKTQLEKNNVYETIMGDINYSASYIVGGLDLSLVTDYTAMVISEAWKSEVFYNRYGKPELEEGYTHAVKEFIIYNLDRVRMDAEVLAEKIAKDCKKYRLDMLLIDNTSSQNTQIQLIQKYVDKLGISTLLVPFNFSGSDKAKLGLVGYAESVLFSGRCKIPIEDYRLAHKPYEIFLNELLVLRKEKQADKQNIQIKAPRGYTDDLCMAFFMSLYCVQHVINIRHNNKLIEIGTKKIFPRLNKFKLLSDSPKNTQPIRDSYISGLF